MDNKRTFKKEEISKILTNASKIQARKDLNADEQGLTEDELVHIAEEVGIDKDSLLAAIQNTDLPEFENNFNWFKSSSNFQDIQTLEGEITEEIWEQIVADIRRVTGGIGKLSRTGESFEWERRIIEVGYQHITFTPKKETTQIQFVSHWSTLELILTIIPFILGVAITGVFLDGTRLPDLAYIIIPLLGGLTGIGTVRFYLKRYFEKQKTQFYQIIKSVKKRLRLPKEPEIVLEEREPSVKATTSLRSDSSRERS